MSALRVGILGSFQLERGDRGDPVALPPIVQSLLGYLVLFRQRRHPRDVLVDIFWRDRDEDRARHCLSTALWRLRSGLEEGAQAGDYVVTTASGDVGFNARSDFWLDASAFERAVGAVLSRPLDEMNPADHLALQGAQSLYRGDLMEGVYYDWAIQERERLRLLYLASLRRAMQFCRRHGEVEAAIAHAQRILTVDPLREDIHRDLIRLYGSIGQRSLAVQQFDACRTVLQEELGIAPMPETTAVFELCRGPGAGIGAGPGASRADPSVPELGGRIRRADPGRRSAATLLCRVADTLELLAAELRGAVNLLD